PTADGLADMLVSRLLDELPDDLETVRGARVVPILNGLGSLKYEEMFVGYRRIARLLDDAGIVAVDPHVGEHCTRSDLAATSLTLFWLDEELEDLWETGVDTPAYRRGSVDTSHLARVETSDEQSEDVIGDADDASREVAQAIAEGFDIWRATIDENVDELGR